MLQIRSEASTCSAPSWLQAFPQLAPAHRRLNRNGGDGGAEMIVVLILYVGRACAMCCLAIVCDSSAASATATATNMTIATATANSIATATRRILPPPPTS